VRNDYNSKIKITNQSLTDRQRFGIVGHRDNGQGDMAIFLNDKIDPDTIVIVSKNYSPSFGNQISS